MLKLVASAVQSTKVSVTWSHFCTPWKISFAREYWTLCNLAYASQQEGYIGTIVAVNTWGHQDHKPRDLGESRHHKHGSQHLKKPRLDGQGTSSKWRTLESPTSSFMVNSAVADGTEEDPKNDSKTVWRPTSHMLVCPQSIWRCVPKKRLTKHAHVWQLWEEPLH